MMKTLVRRLTLAFAVALVAASAAEAQATRTWVSGVGDDANPCSRTAPCKTFAGAISKTATGGEINVLDPGGFGGVTITKSITISSESFEAGVLVSGTNAIVVNAPTTAFVVLRGLDFEGLGTGLNGIRFLAGKSLHVENCTINRFTQFGIDFNPSTAGASMVVKDTIIRNNLGVAGGGIRVRPSVLGVTPVAQLDNVTLDRNRIGLLVENTANATLVSSVVSNSTVQGINVNAVTAGQIPLATLSASTIANNVLGVRVANSAQVRMTALTVTLNGTAVDSSGGGIVSSLGNNAVFGNGGGEGPFPTVPPL
jgi:hypothetical protein